MFDMLKSHCRFANQVEEKFETHFRYFVESDERRGTAEHGYSKIASKTLSAIRECAKYEYEATLESARITDESL